MPKGVYKRTEEHKKHSSEVRRGCVLSEEHKRKISEALKGRIPDNLGLLHKLRIGKKHTEEAKRKVSQKNKGNIPWNKGLTKETDERIRKSGEKGSVTNKGRTSWNEGKKLGKNPEHSKRMKENPIRYWLGKKRPDMTGENNNKWKGGITPENKKIRHSIEFRLWRESVFARDNWTCQKCKIRGGIKLHSHHIQNFAQWPELRFAIDNGITFCKDCHKLFHKLYGRKNNTKEQLEEFLCLPIKTKN